jgi:DNA-directed RNA polymerase specialized sigma24 family protein
MLELLEFEPAAAPYDYSGLIPGAERQVLRLVLFEDKSYREAACALDISEGEIQTRLLRARKRLGAADDSVAVD